MDVDRDMEGPIAEDRAEDKEESSPPSKESKVSLILLAASPREERVFITSETADNPPSMSFTRFVSLSRSTTLLAASPILDMMFFMVSLNASSYSDTSVPMSSM